MSKLTLLNDGSVHEFTPGGFPYGSHGRPGSVLDLARHLGLPLNHVCGGFCSCTTCNFVLVEGAENVSAPEQDELDMLDGLAGGTDQSRLGCQTIVNGDITIRIPD